MKSLQLGKDIHGRSCKETMVLVLIIISLGGVQASELLGATMLVRADERPSLEDDEEYIPDLVGMSVILQVNNLASVQPTPS